MVNICLSRDQCVCCSFVWSYINNVLFLIQYYTINRLVTAWNNIYINSILFCPVFLDFGFTRWLVIIHFAWSMAIARYIDRFRITLFLTLEYWLILLINRRCYQKQALLKGIGLILLLRRAWYLWYNIIE